MKTLLYCPDLDRAYIIKGHLESEGITAEVINQVNATPFPYPALKGRGSASWWARPISNALRKL